MLSIYFGIGGNIENIRVKTDTRNPRFLEYCCGVHWSLLWRALVTASRSSDSSLQGSHMRQVRPANERMKSERTEVVLLGRILKKLIVELQKITNPMK